ncbi:MAG: extracellular solute-binding protein [Anaerolineales bacterium]|nr:extracellular solute-binding protein [Anaerolineales bacterium]
MVQLPVSVNTLTSDTAEALRPLLDRLQEEKGIEVILEVYDWGTALHNLNQISIRGHGPVISQIGTTWMGSLAPQRTLRPFSKREITALGGHDAFIPASWQSTHEIGETETFSIPWLMDTHVIYYRNDALQKAGIRDATSALGSLEQLPKTLEALKASGHGMPWANHSGVKSLSMVHHISNWIWGMGGDFVSQDDGRVIFNSPMARAGMRQYFELQRFLTPEAKGLYDDQFAAKYFKGQAAVTFCSPIYVYQLCKGAFSAEVTQNTSVAVPPGVPFVGGSNWVIWSHIPPQLEAAALNFIAYITSRQAQTQLYENSGLLPARLEALLSITKHPLYSAVLQTLQKGRPFPSTKLWGMIEDKLTEALFRISETLIDNPLADMDSVFDEYLNPLERRLNLTLSNL